MICSVRNCPWRPTTHGMMSQQEVMLEVRLEVKQEVRQVRLVVRQQVMLVVRQEVIRQEVRLVNELPCTLYMSSQSLSVSYDISDKVVL